MSTGVFQYGLGVRTKEGGGREKGWERRERPAEVGLSADAGGHGSDQQTGTAI